jgi:hypothetical protein
MTLSINKLAKYSRLKEFCRRAVAIESLEPGI